MNYTTIENFKTVCAYLTPPETVLKSMNFIGPLFENLLFAKTF